MTSPSFYTGSIGGAFGTASIDLGVVDKYIVALNILRAVRALALNTGDDDLTAYALRLQDAIIEWNKILPKDSSAEKEPGPRGDYL